MELNNPIQITLPASKSISNRWLVMDFISANGIRIKNLSSADDTQLLKRLLRQLKLGRRHTFECHDAGAVARFITPLLAFTPGTHTITASERLCERPMLPLINALRSVGCQIKCLEKEGHLPLKIFGVIPMVSRMTVDGSQSSQFVSALLMAGGMLPHGMAVEVTGLKASEPFIQMTLDVMTEATVNWSYKGVPPAYHIEHSMPRIDMVSIEKDWTSASYFYNVAAFDQRHVLRMTGLSKESSQGDSIIKELYQNFGVTTQQNDQNVEIHGGGNVCEQFEYDFLGTPDLFPSIAVACAALGVDARLRGITNLRYKESDRANAVVEELQAMGCTIERSEDEIHLLPSKLDPIHPINGHNDHRIVMAFATLRHRFPAIEIKDQQVVSKSFPNFWDMMSRIPLQ
ncbi:MAG: hypothetical protein IJV22_05135 [Bacteroidales bacterium]|nr:hypothetical protein [Bacteroidales bacterium]